MEPLVELVILVTGVTRKYFEVGFSMESPNVLATVFLNMV